jgi:hypothetical protein
MEEIEDWSPEKHAVKARERPRMVSRMARAGKFDRRKLLVLNGLS